VFVTAGTVARPTPDLITAGRGRSRALGELLPLFDPLAYDTTPRDYRLIMNQSQQEAVDRVFEILSEHFDHVVIAVGTYDEDKQYTTAASFTGGVAAAIGLCKLYEAKWTKEHLWGPDDHDEDDDSNGR
jgi:ATP phosphoribosyltransferase regulatory subunit HisZ